MSLLWSCENHLLAQELAGDRTRLVDLGAATQPVPGKVLWSGAETIEHGDASLSLACPSGLRPAQWSRSPPAGNPDGCCGQMEGPDCRQCGHERAGTGAEPEVEK